MNTSPASDTHLRTNPLPADIVRRFYASLRAGNMVEAGSLLSDGVVLHVPGRHQLAGDYHGAGGIARFAAASTAAAERSDELQLIDVLSGERFVAAYCLVTGRRIGHAPLQNHTVHLVRVESGRIAEIWFHNYDQHAVDEFWGGQRKQ